ncbi:formyl transferase [Podospora didyma]|uniref:methionyl-tRNA formyltransferase n=1 Tax=Podospora didyma TaxID=330526 RepID=A0AAE0KKQ0_9PEZI|nr:formyl transferase [Podospora didyma]
MQAAEMLLQRIYRVPFAPLRLATSIRQPRIPQFFVATCLYSSSTTKVSDPLRILFCGSDEFSCASLRALHAEHKRNASLIRSIDVVVRPGKRTGRGLKVVHEAPIRKVADELGLAVHERDTFTGWNMPRPNSEPINLIVAVSFGLFVPPRLLTASQYGGLNVHPSFLPDLRGPAPLHHALLAKRTHTGVSLQTLSPLAFDAGTILAQTPLPGIPIPPSCTVTQLRDQLAPLGAEMLVRGLRDGVHAPPHEPVGWMPSSTSPPLKHAPKLTQADKQVLWSRSSAEDIALQSRVLGPVWTRALLHDGREKRLMLEDLSPAPQNTWPAQVISFVRTMQQQQQQQQKPASGVHHSSSSSSTDLSSAKEPPKTITWLEASPPTNSAASSSNNTRHHRKTPYFIDEATILVPMAKGGFLRIGSIKVEGDKSRNAATAIKPFSQEQEPVGSGSYFVDELIGLFLDPRLPDHFSSWLEDIDIDIF